jgi:GMP synthase-like glutamine amidotransferase
LDLNDLLGVAVRALFIMQDHVSPTGPVGDRFAARGYDIDELLVVPEHSFHAPGVIVDFPDPSGYDAIVAMGAPWSVYDHDLIGSWVSDEIGLLRDAHEHGVPVFGICFGGQALAAALGGRVVRAGHPEIGWAEVASTDPDLVEPGPWFEWHGDRWVLPNGLDPLARTVHADQAFTLGRSLGVQFHPEMTPAMLEGWLGNGGARHAAELGIDPDDLRRETASEAAASAARAGRLVDRFLDRVASRPLVGIAHEPED